MADAVIKVTGDLSDITAKFGELRGQLDGLGAKATESSAKLAEATKPLSDRLTALGTGATAYVSGAAAAAGALVTVMGRDAGKYAEQVQQISAQTGLTTDLVQTLNVAFNRVGLGLNDILPAFRKFSAEIRDLENDKKAAVATFESIGFSVDDLKGKKPDEAFSLIAQKLGGMDEGFVRTTASADLFGRSGLRFIPLFHDVAGGFDQVAADARAMGGVFDLVRLQQLTAMDDKFDDLDSSVKALSRTFGANFVGPLDQAASAIIRLVEAVTASVSNLPQPLVAAFGVLFVGGAAIAPALLGLAALVRSIETLTPLVVGLYALILAHPFVAIGAAVVALATLIIANWSAIRDTTVSVWNAITAKLSGVWEEIKGTGITQWTTLRVFVTQTIGAMVTEIGNWMGAKLQAAMGLANAPIQAAFQAFAWLHDKVTGHSEIPDMVQEIGDHMALLDVRMGSPSRIAATNTLKLFQGMRFDLNRVFTETVNVAVSTWGQVTNALSQGLAQNLIKGNNWAQTWQTIQNTVLTGFINLGLQTLTQGAITLAKQVLFGNAEADAHAAVETAKTTATGIGEGARLGITLATNKAVLGGVIATLAGIEAVGDSAVGVLEAVVIATAGVLAAIGAALLASVVGAPLAPAFEEAAGTIVVAGTVATVFAAGAIQDAVGSATIAATAALGVPAFASGGAVFGPTLALVGENATHSNPEFIGHASQLGLGSGGGQQTIIVQLDGREVARNTLKHLPGIVYLKTGKA